MFFQLLHYNDPISYIYMLTDARPIILKSEIYRNKLFHLLCNFTLCDIYSSLQMTIGKCK